MSPDAVRAAYAALREDVGPAVTVVVATKYVPLDEMAVLVEAGVEVVGENRAQDLERKHAEYGDAFRWHFIGHLQSNKAKVVNRICELVHSLDSDSAAQRLTVPALVEVNLAGEASKSGVAPADLAVFLREHPGARGLMTMPPETADAEASRPYFRRLRELAGEHALDELSMGTSQDYRVAVEEGATLIRVGSVLFQRVTSASRWASRTSGTERSCTSGSPRTTEWDEDGYATNEELERTYGAASGRTSGACSRAVGVTSTTGAIPSRRRRAPRHARPPGAAASRRCRAQRVGQGAPRAPAQLQRRTADR